MSTAAIIAGTAAASIGSAAIGANAAGNAANSQVAAANHAADLQHQDAQQALAFQKQEYGDQQKNQAPFLQAGQKAIGDLSGLLSNGGFPDFNEQFVAPTAATEANDPGYQFRLQQGQQALDRGASASGNLLSGGEGKALQQFGQDYASNEYGNVYNRALQQYQQKYNIFQNNQAGRFNRLATVAGVGQTSAGQLGSSGGQAAGNIGNILLSGGQQIGNDYQNAAAARASGYIGGANAYGGAFNAIGSDFSQSLLLRSLLSGSGGLAFGGLSPGQISGAFGGPTNAGTITTDTTGLIG